MVIYGVDIDKPVSTLEARDAIMRCFIEAHFEDAQKQGITDPLVAEKTCRDKVQEAFQKTGGDFQNPTKGALLNAVGFLAEFSKTFRDPTIIEKHKTQIMQLLSIIPGEPFITPATA
jgi:hypothetical protein